MEVDYSSSILISRQAVMKSKLPFSRYNLMFWPLFCLVSLYFFDLITFGDFFLSFYFKIIKQAKRKNT